MKWNTTASTLQGVVFRTDVRNESLRAAEKASSQTQTGSTLSLQRLSATYGPSIGLVGICAVIEIKRQAEKCCSLRRWLAARPSFGNARLLQRLIARFDVNARERVTGWLIVIKTPGFFHALFPFK